MTVVYRYEKPVSENDVTHNKLMYINPGNKGLNYNHNGVVDDEANSDKEEPCTLLLPKRDQYYNNIINYTLRE